MSTQDNHNADAERMSALMDGELPEREARALLDRIAIEPVLQGRWARYHAARSALDTGAARMSPDFAERVRAAREREPAILTPGRTQSAAAGWRRPLAGFAIAASVALVAFGALNVLRDAPTTTAPSPVADAGSGNSGALGDGRDAVTPVAVAPGGPAVAGSGAVRERLMLYLASHNGYADTVDMPTVIPYGRLSSLNAGQ